MIWRRDNSSPSGRICSTEGRPIQERRHSHCEARGSRSEMEMSRQHSIAEFF